MSLYLCIWNTWNTLLKKDVFSLVKTVENKKCTTIILITVFGAIQVNHMSRGVQQHAHFEQPNFICASLVTGSLRNDAALVFFANFHEDKPPSMQPWIGRPSPPRCPDWPLHNLWCGKLSEPIFSVQGGLRCNMWELAICQIYIPNRGSILPE